MYFQLDANAQPYHSLIVQNHQFQAIYQLSEYLVPKVEDRDKNQIHLVQHLAKLAFLLFFRKYQQHFSNPNTNDNQHFDFPNLDLRIEYRKHDRYAEDQEYVLVHFEMFRLRTLCDLFFHLPIFRLLL